MKKLNFLSNLWSLLVGSRKDDGSTRYRLVIDSLSTRYRVWQVISSRMTAVFLLLLTLGIGNAWGADAVVYTLTCPKSTSNNNYASNYNLTVSGIGWNAPGNQYADGAWRIGGKSITKVDRKIYSKTAIANDISKIDVVFGASSGSITVNSVTLNVYSTAAKAAAGGTGDVSSSSITYAASSTKTVSVPSGKSWKGRFYGLTINVTVSGSNNKYVTLSAIKFYTPTYTVTYNANGGSGTLTDASSPYFKDATVTVKSNTFTRDGYTFNGWNTASGGSGTSYAAGATFSITANTTLYAQWEELSCTAPNHVDVSGAWDRFAGEQISLTATAYSSAGTGSPISAGDITGYQWYKGGTAEGNKIAGATSATYTKNNCTLADAGDYYCKISTGATCSTMSSSFGVKVYALDCYTGGAVTHNFTRVGATQTGTLQLTLTASTGYEFKVRQGSVYLGYSGTINEDENTWEFTTSGNNVTVNSGLGGTFTFTLDYSSNADEPILAVTYPRKTIYLVPNSDWLSNSAKFAYYYYGASGGTGWTDFIEANACGMSAEIPQWNGLNVIAVRFNPSDATPGWNGEGHVWNQTSDVTVTADKDLITITGWNNSQTYTAYTIPTYAISYNKGTNGVGTRANDTKTCGTAFTLPDTQVFTRDGYTMDGWATSDGGDKAYNLGGSYTTNAAQTFYPHWAIVNYTITYNLNGGTQQVSPAPATSYNINSSAITLPTPTREGYTFSGWYTNSDLSTGGVQTSIAAGSTGNKTYWAKWTIKSYTVDWYVGGTSEEDKLTTGSQTTNVNHGSKVTTLPSTPSGAACDLTFIGWTNTTSYTHGTSTLFTTAAGSPAVTSATRYYAVFAAGSAPATKNLTNSEIQTFHTADASNRGYAKGPFTISSAGGDWYGVCATAVPSTGVYTLNIKSEKVTIDGVDYLPYLRSPEYSSDITSVTITHNCDAGRTVLICSSASATPAKDKIATIAILSGNQSGVTSTSIPSGVKQIYLYSSDKSIAIKSIAVSIGGYSGYTLTCEACATSVTPTFTASPEGGTVAVSKSGSPVTSGTEVKTCGGVALAVTITPDSHHKLSNFTATGLTTGTATITPSVATTLATPQASAQIFTVTLSDGAEGTLTLTPTFSENAYRTVVFVNNNAKLYDDGGDEAAFDATNKWKQKVYVGEKPVLPTALTASEKCDASSTTFMGWVRDNQRWPGKSASGMPAGSTLITAASGFDAAAAGSGEIAYHAVWAERSGDVIKVSANLATLKAAVSSISSGYANKEFEMTYSTESYTFNATVTKNTYSTTKDWMQVGKIGDSRYITITDEFPGSITNISSTSIYNASGSTYSGTVYYNSAASTTDPTPIASITLSGASSFSLDVEDGETGGYIMFSSAICLGDLSVTYSTLSYSNYMTTCCASTGLTLTGPTGDIVFITSAAEKKVRSQEAFHISGCGVSGNTTVTFDFGSTALNSKFTCGTETGGTLSTTCDGRIDTDFYIFYTPGAGDTDDGIDKSTSLTASVTGTLAANTTLSTKTIIGRHLPENFVIAAKSGGKWYALPANMSPTSTPAPVELAVNDATKPTLAIAPDANVYSLYPPTSDNISDGNGQYIRLAMHGVDKEGGLYAPLFGSSTGTYKVGKSGNSQITSKLSAGWWWKLQQTNTSISAPEDATYNIYTPNNTNSLKLYNDAEKWGLYATGAKNVDEMRLIPCFVTNHLAAEVSEWTEDDIWVEASPSSVSATKVTATIDGGSESSKVPLTNASASSHVVTFTGADFTGKEDELMMLKWYNSSNTLVAASFVLMPSIISTSATSWASISPAPTIDDIVVLKSATTVGATGKAKRVVLDQSGSSGKLEISAGKELVVAETVRKFNGTTFGATGESDINIGSTSALGLGALVMGNHDGTNKATVNFYTRSKGDKHDNTSVGQYVGTPFSDETNILYNWYNSWVYKIIYNSGVMAWERVNEGQGMDPFKGYCVFSADAWDNGEGHSYWMQGTLVSSANHTCSGLNWKSGTGTANLNNENLLANSWMAPIKISAMQTSDFTNAEATIYIFNSTSNSGYSSLGGNYDTYTVGTSTDVIPAMQSFSVFTKGSSASVTLDYNRIVYAPALAGTATPIANKAPQRAGASEDEADKMRLFVRTEDGYGDMLYMWEREDFEEGFENGWDGRKLYGESYAPQLYAITPDGEMAVNCVPDWEGTVLGFKKGTEDNVYTFTFEYEGENTWYLNDMKEQTSTLISSESRYMFMASDEDMAARFIISRTPIHSTPTGIEQSAISGQKSAVRKIVIDDHVYIIRNGKMYSAEGVMVR